MEPEKSPKKVVSAVCTLEPRKASGVIQSKSKDLQARGADGVNPSPRAGEDKVRCPAQVVRWGEK